MFDLSRSGSPEPHAPTAADLDRARSHLAVLDGAGDDEEGQISLIAALEKLKSAAAAAQARVTDSLARARSEREAERGVPAAKRCQGLAAEVALARRSSPHRGSRDLGLATALVHEMPHTLDLLGRGEISEWRATLVARETAVLSVQDRRQVDAELAEKLAGLGDRQAGAAARSIGYRLDPESAIRRTRLARSDRFVSLRPAPDAMSYLTALLPVQQGVACLAALRQAADTVRSVGSPVVGSAADSIGGSDTGRQDHPGATRSDRASDQRAGGTPEQPRSRGQVMADTLVERLTGQARACDVDVEVHVVMTDRSLLTDDHTPAEVVSYGPVHAALARAMVHDAPRAWLRRLFTRPGSGDLVATDSRRRVFSGELRDLLVVRDQVCRTPWCDAPVRHADHVVPAADGGETSLTNGQGLCEACNYAKQSPGWRATPLPGVRHQVLTVTPTGHTHVSTAPDPPGWSALPPEEDRGDVVHAYQVWRTLEDDLRLLVAGAARR